MAQPSSAPDSDPKTVFVDTNFDNSNLKTHLGLSFTATDTVSDLKQKILVEHPICFPEFGEIQIHALKLKRRGKFYHLSDSIYIKDALGGFKLNGFLCVDASSSLEHGEKLQLDPSFDQGSASPHVAHVLPGSGSRRLANSNGLSLPQVGQIPCANEEVRVTKRLCSGGSSRESSRDPMTEVKHISDNHCELASPVGNTQLNSETRDKCDLGREDLEGPDKEIQCMAGNSRNGTLEGPTQNDPTAKENKRNKHKKKEDKANDVYEGIEVSVHNSPATKRRKAEKNNNKKDAYNGMVEPQYSLGEKIGRKNAASPSLSVESAEGICSLLSTGKKKRKSSDSHIAVATDLSHGKESREEKAQGILENNKDSEETEAVVSGKSAPSETITKVKAASLKKKHDLVKEVAERNIPGSLDVDTRDPNVCDVGAETNGFGVEKMDTDGESEERATEQVPLSQKINESQAGSGNLDGTRKGKTKKRQTDVARSAVEVQEKDQDTGVKMPVVPSDMEMNDVSKIKAGGISLIGAGGETEKRTEEEVPSLQETSKSQADGEHMYGIRERKTKKRQTVVAISAVEVQEKEKDSGLEIPEAARDTESNDLSKIKTDGISVVAAGGETEKRTEENVPSLQEVSKSQAGGGNVDGAWITMKRQTDIARSLSEIQEKDQDLGLNSSILSCDTKVVDASSERTKKMKLEKSSLDPKVAHGKDGCAAADTELVSETDCSQVPSHVTQDNDAGQALEPVGTADSHNSGYVDEGNNQNGDNFKDYFVHGQDEREVKSAGKVVDNVMIIDHKSDEEPKTRKNTEKLAFHPISSKSLLATSSAIFEDSDSSSSFGDQAGVDSDACTRNNLSSSDEEIDASLNVADSSSEGEEDGRSSQILSPVPKDAKLNSILRNSSRYKKIKSQSQLEGLASDFVPDSEVNLEDP